MNSPCNLINSLGLSLLFLCVTWLVKCFLFPSFQIQELHSILMTWHICMYILKLSWLPYYTSVQIYHSSDWQSEHIRFTTVTYNLYRLVEVIHFLRHQLHSLMILPSPAQWSQCSQLLKMLNSDWRHVHRHQNLNLHQWMADKNMLWC